MKLRILAFLMLLSPLHAAEHPWVSLFNGKDLSGWTPKITGHPCGVNAHDTFRVEDGILKVGYDRYGKFASQYGHLYSNFAYSHYVLRMEYRFEGPRMADAPGYVNLNSGVMIHAQPPQSLALNQNFPVSLEFQFLADEGTGKRATANVCTPGTVIDFAGKKATTHIVESTAPTFPAGEWVKIEVEVHGNKEIIHRVNGQEVLRYQNFRLDPACKIASAAPLVQAGVPLTLSSGHIALQAEGQGVWFRNIEMKPLEN